MSKIRQRYDDEFRKNAVKLSYVTTKPIKEFCADLGIHHSMIYRLAENLYRKPVKRPR